MIASQSEKQNDKQMQCIILYPVVVRKLFKECLISVWKYSPDKSAKVNTNKDEMIGAQ